MTNKADELNEFLTKIVTQLDVLQNFFLDNQQRLINVEMQVKNMSFVPCKNELLPEGLIGDE